MGWSAEGGAAALDQDDVAPATVVLADPLPDPGPAESGVFVEGEALLVFSGKIPDWIVQIPACSVEVIRASSSSSLPTP